MERPNLKKAPRRYDRHLRLTKAEAATFELMERGMAADEIAKSFNVTKLTVQMRIKIIKEKLE